MSEPAGGPNWAPISRSNLGEEIAERLIKSILDGEYRFGQQLPTERDIARYLAVGRPSVREAIRILSVLGLVEVRPGEGTFVVAEHAAFVAKAFSWAVLLDAKTVRDIIETRTAIESELAGIAAKRATAEDLEKLDGLIAEMDAAQGDIARFSEADLQFHLTVGEAARNLTLSRLLFATQSLLRDWIGRALAEPGTDVRALDQHRAILAGIQSGEPAAASAAMRAHVEAMGELITPHASPQPAATPGPA